MGRITRGIAKKLYISVNKQADASIDGCIGFLIVYSDAMKSLSSTSLGRLNRVRRR